MSSWSSSGRRLAMPPNRKRSSTASSGQNIKAISISVIDPNNQTAYLDEVAAKVPLLAVDNDAPKSKRRCYIGTDNYSAAEQPANSSRKHCPMAA